MLQIRALSWEGSQLLNMYLLPQPLNPKFPGGLSEMHQASETGIRRDRALSGPKINVGVGNQ